MREGLARYGIDGPTASTAFGVPMGAIRKLARQLGRSHDLALDLWGTGQYEARMLAVFVDEPARVTTAQMDRWARDFDNWATCDTACFHLFDRTPHAMRMVRKWSSRRAEFVRRAAFALLASAALHDKQASDEAFSAALPLIAAAARDERNFVKKAVSWALRSVGKRRAALRAECTSMAARLAASEDATSRWIGKDALRDLG